MSLLRGLALHHIANTAYPIGHLTTMRPYLVPRSQVQSTASQAWQEINRLGLYLHIPFCEARCGFCEYTVVDPATISSDEDLYFDLLLKEIALYRQAVQTDRMTLVGLDIGGGTPSVAKTANLARLLAAVRGHFILPEAAGISIETTPKIAAQQPEKIQAYRQLGIQRISMGVQTISPSLLQAVGRTATRVDFNYQAVENIRRAGFHKFNIDIMYGFAHQSLESLAATLQHVITLQPDYITLYRTRYKGTRIAAQAEQVTLAEINEQVQLAKTMLQAAGYWGTTGKNTFSKMAGEVGVSDYLSERVIHGTPYLGLGLGAQSLSQVTLSYNAGAADKRLDHYRRMLAANRLPIQDLYHLSPQAAMGKMISVSFYFGEINLESFRRKFGVALEQAFPAEVEFVLSQGLMEIIEDSPNRCPQDAPAVPEPGRKAHQGFDGSFATLRTSAQPPGECAPERSRRASLHRTLRLTAEGEACFNGVIALFYAGAVKRHLLERAAAQSQLAATHIPLFSGQAITNSQMEASHISPTG